MLLSFFNISLFNSFTVIFPSDCFCPLNFLLSAILSSNSFGSDSSNLNPPGTYSYSLYSFGSYFFNFGIGSGI